MKLIVYKNDELISEIDFTQEVQGGGDLTFLIGRNKDCHVHLEDKKISREHAELLYQGGIWRIKRLSEFGNLIVNGSSTKQVELKNGDIFNLGSFSINVFMENGATTGIINLATDSSMQEELRPEVNQGFDPLEREEEIGEANILSEEPDIEDALLEFPQEEDHEEASEAEGLGETEVVESFGEESAEIDDEPVFEDNSFENGEVEDVVYPEEEYDENIEGAFEENDDYAVEEYEDESDKTQVLQSFASFYLEIFGEHAPYDKYSIEKPKTSIGRDPEKCEIVLSDPEVSSVHATISRLGSSLFLEDNNSGNGTLLNGSRVNKEELKNEDEFIVGSTTFTVRMVSDFIKEEEKNLMPVAENQVVEVEEVVEVDTDFDDEILGDFDDSASSGSQSLFSKDALSNPEKRKKLMIILVVLLGLWVLLDEGDQGTKPKKSKEDQAKLLAAEKKKKEAEKQRILSNDKFEKLSEDDKEFVNANYELARTLYEQGKYSDALLELGKIFAYVDNFKNARQIESLSKEGVQKLEKLEKERIKEEERKKRIAKVAELVDRAKNATKEKKVQLAETLFVQILKMDPENLDVPQFKMEIKEWQDEKERIAIEKAQKEGERNRKVSLLAPGKAYYLQEKWFKAILKLEEFQKIKNMDEDLSAEATKMLTESKENLKNTVEPLLGKARSLKEGQDFKASYELYQEILEHDPSHEESLNELAAIRERIERRSMKIYREAIISESQSRFDEAKEKFQEVQQITPKDIRYYRLATDKLWDYLD